MKSKASISRLDNVLVLQEHGRKRMVFSFRGRRWSLITLLLAIGVGVGTYTFKGHSQYENLLSMIGTIFTLLFLYSSLVSFTARRTLEINGYRKLVSFTSRDLYRRREWTREFRDFEGVTIFRPKAGSGTGRAAFLKLLLVTTDGEEIVLGASELGVLGIEKAKGFAKNISDIMGLQVTEEPSVSRKA